MASNFWIHILDGPMKQRTMLCSEEFVKSSLKEQQAMQLWYTLWTDGIFSDSLHTQNLLGVVVLRALYSPLHNWSLTVSSDPCQSSVRVMSAVVHGRRREAQYNHDFEQLG